METIILNDGLDANVLEAYLIGLKKAGRYAFFKERRSEIMNLSNTVLLKLFFDFGFHTVILLFLKAGFPTTEIEDMLLDIFAEKHARSLIKVTKEERHEIIRECAKSADLVLFLRSKTMVFTASGYRISLFEAAVAPVIDSIFLWNVAHRIPLTVREAYYMYAKAAPKVIRSYLKKIGCLTGEHKNVTYQMLKALAQREDIDAEDRHELLLLSVNTLPVHTQTIYELRKGGLLGF